MLAHATSRARTDMHSPRTPMLPLTSVSRICSLDVRPPLFSSTFQVAGLTSTDGNGQSRHVELDVDIGADAKDWSAIQAGEKLKPVEMELRRVEEMVREVSQELDYLKIREQKLRDTNESTNERVKWFAYGTMGMLMGLGTWQIIYLRAYFRSVLYTPRFCNY